MATLDECRGELRSIISELRDIEAGVRSDFDGIGEALCADSIGLLAEKYEYVQQRLKNVRLNVIAELINPDS